MHMKLILKFLLAAVAFVADDAWGQASFAFRNYHPAGVDAPVFDANGNRLFGDNYVAVLYGGPSANNLELARIRHLGPSMEPVPFGWVVNGQNGYFTEAGGVLIESVPGVGIAWLQVRAWDLRVGHTYDEVASLGLGGYGESLLFQATGGDPASLIPPQPLLGLQSFSLVPEPSTWALLTLGAGFLCWRWRRKT